jgi:hypothetical protein
MAWIGNIFCIGMVFGLGAAALAGGRWNALVAIVGLYAVSLAALGFVAAMFSYSIVPYLVPWVASPAIGSLVGGCCFILTRPGVIADLVGLPERRTS